jgi:hypothetical protein
MISLEAPGPFDKESVTIARVADDRRRVSSVDEKKTNGRPVRNSAKELNSFMIHSVWIIVHRSF